MWSEIKIRPSTNKSRFGYRGKKQRYSVFKAQWNKKWASVEEREVRELCDKHDLDPEMFIRPEDNPNRKWSYALIRCKRLTQNPKYPNIMPNGRSPFYRYKCSVE